MRGCAALPSAPKAAIRPDSSWRSDHCSRTMATRAAAEADAADAAVELLQRTAAGARKGGSRRPHAQQQKSEPFPWSPPPLTRRTQTVQVWGVAGRRPRRCVQSSGRRWISRCPSSRKTVGQEEAEEDEVPHAEWHEQASEGGRRRTQSGRAEEERSRSPVGVNAKAVERSRGQPSCDGSPAVGKAKAPQHFDLTCDDVDFEEYDFFPDLCASGTVPLTSWVQQFDIAGEDGDDGESLDMN